MRRREFLQKNVQATLNERDNDMSRQEYDRLCEAALELADLQAFDLAKAGLNSGQDELIPGEFANRLLDGEAPLLIYRGLRGLTQAQLSEKSGVHRVTISEIETVRREGSVRTVKALAEALAISLDDLIV